MHMFSFVQEANMDQSTFLPSDILDLPLESKEGFVRHDCSIDIDADKHSFTGYAGVLGGFVQLLFINGLTLTCCYLENLIFKLVLL